VYILKAYKKEPFDNATKIYVNGGIGYIKSEIVLKRVREYIINLI